MLGMNPDQKLIGPGAPEHAPPPRRIVDIDPDACPDCGKKLCGGRVCFACYAQRQTEAEMDR